MPHTRRGNYATFTALSLSALLGAGAISVDLLYNGTVRMQLQNGADAIAHAAVMQLDGTAEGMALATDVATELATNNTAGGSQISMAPDGFALGHWDADAMAFIETSAPEDVTAVRVQLLIEGAGEFFSPASFGDIGLSARARAIAVVPTPDSGADTVDCFMPLAVSSCLLEDEYGVNGVQMVDLLLNPPAVDNTGWARPGGQPSAAWASGMISDCDGEGSLSIGDTVELGNGVLTSTMSALADAIETSETTWDSDVWGDLPEPLNRSAISEDAYGATWEAPIVVFDDDTYCAAGGGSWNGTQSVVGFAWAAAYDVVTAGPAADKTIRIRLDTSRSHEVGTGDGGPDWGVHAESAPILVR